MPRLVRRAGLATLALVAVVVLLAAPEGAAWSPAHLAPLAPAELATAASATRGVALTYPLPLGGPRPLVSGLSGLEERTLDLVNGSLLPGNNQPQIGSLVQGVSVFEANHTAFVISTGNDRLIVVALLSDRVVAWRTTNASPYGVAVDPVSHQVFVTLSGDHVEIFDAWTYRWIATVFDKGAPAGIEYDPWNGDVYTANGLAANVTAIDGATDKVLRSYPVGKYPDDLVGDPTNGLLYVSDSGDSPGNVTVINLTTNKSVASVVVGSSPNGMTYDPLNRSILVANQGNSNFSVINDTSNHVTRSWHVGSGPWDVGFDPESDLAFVSNEVSANISVLNLSTGRYLPAMPAPQAYAAFFGLAVATAEQQVLVTNWDGGNLLVGNATSGAEVGTVAFQAQPAASADDPVAKAVVVTDPDSGVVDLINATTDLLAAQLTDGAEPWGVTYDPLTSEMVVSNRASVNLSVLNITTPSLRPIDAGVPTSGGVYVPGNRSLFLLDESSDNLTVLNATTYNVTGTIKLPKLPDTDAITYDPLTDTVVVLAGAFSSASFEFINASNRTYYLTVNAAGNPLALVADPHSGDIFASNWFSNNVTVVNGSTGAPVGSISLPFVSSYPNTIGYDAVLGAVLVGGQNNLSVVNASSRSVEGWVVTGNTPVGFSSDPSTGTTFAVNAYSGSATIFGPNLSSLYPVTFTEGGLDSGLAWSIDADGAPAPGTAPGALVMDLANGSYPFAVGPDPGFHPNPSNGTFTVNGSATTIAINWTGPPSYPVNFSETGLPTGTSWQVTFDGRANQSTGATVAFVARNGSYDYSVTTVAGYDAHPSSGRTTVSGGPASVLLSFSPIPTYAVTFRESGLAPGTTWSITFGGPAVNGSARSFSFLRENGSYAYSVAPVSGYHESPSNGSVEVTGAAVNISVTFEELFFVNFVETGLPTGTSWGVNLSGNVSTTSGPAIAFEAVDGAYPYTVSGPEGMRADPDSGSATVAGANQTIDLAFAAILYNVTFTEAGLPTGTSWSITLAGTTLVGSSANLLFEESNGSYPYAVGQVPGWSTPGFSGAISVTGGPAQRGIAWSRVLYAVVLTESGLPTGTNWSATLGGVDEATNTDSLHFSEPNGSYSYSIGDVPGWKVNSTLDDLLTIAGATVPLDIAWTPFTFSVVVSETGLPAGTNWSGRLYGPREHTTGTELTFQVPNGTYAFLPGRVPGYNTGFNAQTIIIAGEAFNQPIGWFRTTYSVQFTTSDLPSGLDWYLTLNGTTHGSAQGQLAFTEPNGTYTYRVSPPANYTAQPSSGTVTVSNGSVSIAVGLVENATGPSQPSSSSSTGFANGTLLLLAVIGGIVVVLAALGVLWGRRRRPPTPRPTPTDDASP